MALVAAKHCYQRPLREMEMFGTFGAVLCHIFHQMTVFS